MPILTHGEEKQKLDVIHISEAGLLKKDPMGMTGYKSVKLARKEPKEQKFQYSLHWEKQMGPQS